MKLAYSMANTLVGLLADSLNGGTLAIYEGSAPRKGLQAPLVTLRLGSPAFETPKGGRAVSRAIPSTLIAASGAAGWAQLVTATGDTAADLIVRARDAEDVDQADIVLDRTDFQRGGQCQLDGLVLKMPVTVDA